MYIVLMDGNVIDAVKTLSYCRYVPRSGLLMRCEANDRPEGIVSERTGEVYHVEGWPTFPDNSGNYETVTISNVDEDTFDTIAEELKNNKYVKLPAEEPKSDIPENPTVEWYRAEKLKNLSEYCTATIVAGVDVMLSDGESHHFSLSVKDQLNLISLSALIMQGQQGIPYHADGEACKYFSAEDFQSIVSAATTLKTYHESYYNSLKAYVESINDIPLLSSIKYGIDIPLEFQSEVYQQFLVGNSTEVD